MLWNASSLVRYAIEASDGTIGSIDDFYFDERHWKVRWIVVDTGGWLTARRVLLSPLWAKHPDAAERKLVVALTKKQVEESPDVDFDKPVSRQIEELVYRHYRFEPYWLGIEAVGTPVPSALREAAGSKPGTAEPGGDPNLQSLDEMTDASIHAIDGDIGHVSDFLLEDEDWSIRYMVVGTRNWWPGKKVLISPHWIGDLSWPEREIKVDLTRAAIKGSPEYDPMRTVDRAFEERLSRHYGYPAV